MKTRLLKKALPILAILVLATSLSSCNRGYGCPNNFSMQEQAAKAVQTIAEGLTIFK